VCWRKEAYLEGKRDDAKELGEKELAAKIAMSRKTDYLDEDDYAFHTSTVDLIEDKNSWFIDSGAPSHMTDQRQLFTSLKPIKKGRKMVKGVGDCLLPAVGIGDVKVKTEVDGRVLNLTLRGVLYVPGVGCNLLSVGATADNGIQTIFDSNGAKLVCKSDGRVVSSGIRKNRTLYLMKITPVTQNKKPGREAAAYESTTTPSRKPTHKGIPGSLSSIGGRIGEGGSEPTKVGKLIGRATEFNPKATNSKKKDLISPTSAAGFTSTKLEHAKQSTDIRSHPSLKIYRSITFNRSSKNRLILTNQKSAGTASSNRQLFNRTNWIPDYQIGAEQPPPDAGHQIDENPVDHPQGQDRKGAVPCTAA